MSPLEGAAGAVGNHCAVRVTTAQSSQVGELLNAGGRNRIAVWNGRAVDALKYGWVGVNVPAPAVIRSFNALAVAYHGRPYSAVSNANSNYFVFQVITNAGGIVPGAAVPASGVTPGICGGSPVVIGPLGALTTGSRCGP